MAPGAAHRMRCRPERFAAACRFSFQHRIAGPPGATFAGSRLEPVASFRPRRLRARQSGQSGRMGRTARRLPRAGRAARRVREAGPAVDGQRADRGAPGVRWAAPDHLCQPERGAPAGRAARRAGRHAAAGGGGIGHRRVRYPHPRGRLAGRRGAGPGPAPAQPDLRHALSGRAHRVGFHQLDAAVCRGRRADDGRARGPPRAALCRAGVAGRHHADPRGAAAHPPPGHARYADRPAEPLRAGKTGWSTRWRWRGATARACP